MMRNLPPDHPQRLPMTLELHARPFPELTAPGEALHLAFVPSDDAPRDAAFSHLCALAARYGAPPPPEGAAHYDAALGRTRLKWERHTEFCTYTFFRDGAAGAPFSAPPEDFAQSDWLQSSPGRLICAIRLHIARIDDMAAAETEGFSTLAPHFVAESLAAASVVDGQAAVMGDFRIHEDGFTRFAILTPPTTGKRRLGRVAQRLIEVETYRAMAMLALPAARAMGPQLDGLETRLGALTTRIAGETGDDHAALVELTRLSAEIESLSADSAYRFAASAAYAALVEERIAVLRETRFANRQLLSEFMSRRFLPAMRSCAASRNRLETLAQRAGRAARLLSTRVNVAVEAQNQELLASMDRRAALQLRLQRTVEGLSVVAISYYALGLAGYLLKPLGHVLGIKPEYLIGAAVIPVVAGVWFALKQVQKHLHE